MARTVDDVALLLSVMAGPDRRSPLSLEEPGSTFAEVPDGGLAGRRIAFSPDLGGAIEIEDEIAGMVRSAALLCEGAGAVVEQASPDFSGADECFRTLRAWQFEATLGALLDQHASTIRPSLYANMLQGRELTGPQVGRAAVQRTVLFHRMREFLRALRRAAAAGVPGAGVRRGPAVPGGGRRCAAGRLPRLDAGGVPRDGHRAPGDLDARPGSPRAVRRSACSSSGGTAGSGSCWGWPRDSSR